MGGGVKQRKKPLSTFSVSVKFWLCSDMYIWVPFYLIQRILGVESGGHLEQGSPELVSDYGVQGAPFKA
jgi:hypothetical protein